MIGKIIKIRAEDRTAVDGVLQRAGRAMAASYETMRNAVEANAKAGAFIERLYPELTRWRYSYDAKRHAFQILSREDEEDEEQSG